MLLKELIEIYKDIKSVESFGGLYKTNKYTLDSIKILTEVPLHILEEEFEKNPKVKVEELYYKDFYQDIQRFIQTIDFTEPPLSTKDQKLFITDYDTISLIQLKAYELEEIIIGKLLEVYDQEDHLIGKAIIYWLSKKDKLAKLKYFIQDGSEASYVKFDKWWTITIPEVKWLRGDLLLSNEISTSSLDVKFHLDSGPVGRIQWSLFYKKTDKDSEVLLAKGIDLSRPGLIYIQQNNSMFNTGKYRLSIIDKRKNINMPVIKTLNWVIDTPTIKLEYDVKQ